MSHVCLALRAAPPAHMTSFREINEALMELLLALGLNHVFEKRDYVTPCPVAVIMHRELDPMTVFRRRAAGALVQWRVSSEQLKVIKMSR